MVSLNMGHSGFAGATAAPSARRARRNQRRISTQRPREQETSQAGYSAPRGPSTPVGTFKIEAGHAGDQKMLDYNETYVKGEENMPRISHLHPTRKRKSSHEDKADMSKIPYYNGIPGLGNYVKKEEEEEW